MSKVSPLEQLQHLIALEQKDIGTLVAYSIGIGLMSLTTPIAVQALVNTIAFGALLQPLFVLTLILLVLVGFSNSLAGLQFYVVEMLQRRIFVRIFGNAATCLQRVSYSQRDQIYLPELANRFLDVVTLQKTAAVLLLETLGYVLQTLIGMVLLAFYHPLLLAFDLVLITLLGVILFTLGQQGLDTAIIQSKAKYKALAWLETIATNPVITKSEYGDAYIHAQTEHIAETYLTACQNHFRILTRQNIGALILHTLASTALLGMGGWMVIEHQLSLGQLIAAELVVSAMVYGLTRLGKMLDNYYELLTSLDKINHILDLPQEQSSCAHQNHPTTPYTLNIISVTMPKSGMAEHLQAINLRLAAGEHIVINHNRDYSSLFDVVFGLRQPAQGYVCVNEQDIRDINLRTLRDTIALVRDAEIIPGSIIDNISLARTIPPDEIRQILHSVGLSSELSNLPEGLHTVLSSDGAPLTPEQSLRLTLARALLLKPRLLLLDGVLDKLKPDVLDDLFNYLCSQPNHLTLLVNSQQPAIIQRFSRQAAIIDGQLVET
ncbi:ATP-binding cassette domain-containing protein [Methylocucumis oryzae]|uniref:Xenobiotic-transporting ATPase n=1 Tax=Methylocucumis oryzae TaxID=1632867 RepID=A0A0F3INA0_9GAMM|nr:ABC transporter ATP-binding protein [Methylocucumis oryzae]KJV07034.1 xenobiotic-transporting ATPase [Methylocucumis oryzae]